MRDMLAKQDQSSQDHMVRKSLFINSFTHTDVDFILLIHGHSLSMNKFHSYTYILFPCQENVTQINTFQS